MTSTSALIASVLLASAPVGPSQAGGAPGANGPLTTSTPPCLDGVPSEWAGVPPTASDPRGDSMAGALDLGAITLLETPEALWVRLELAGEPVNIQSLPDERSIELIIDADGSAKSGEVRGTFEGADLLLRFSPQGEGVERPGRGVLVEAIVPERLDSRRRDRTPSATAAGFGMAPSSASTWIELRLPRAGRGGATGIRFGDEARISARIVGKDGSVLDDGATATHRFALKPEAPVKVVEPIPSAAETEPRVLSWNVERGSIFKNPEPFAEVLRALAPDVLLLQELDATATEQSLAAWLDERAPTDGGWKVVVSGGDLRVAVASPHLAAVPSLAKVSREGPSGSRPVRAIGAVREFGGRRLLAVSIHLKCCGSIGSSEDRTREAEVSAIGEAIRLAVERAASAGQPIEGVVIGGDFNLVGGSAVLELACEGLDLDGSPLAAADLFTLDRRSNLTWRDEGSEFLPGRLDFLLFADSRLRLVRGAVVDPASVLPANAAAKAPSDHLPIVADFQWLGAP